MEIKSNALSISRPLTLLANARNNVALRYKMSMSLRPDKRDVEIIVDLTSLNGLCWRKLLRLFEEKQDPTYDRVFY